MPSLAAIPDEITVADHPAGVADLVFWTLNRMRERPTGRRIIAHPVDATDLRLARDADGVYLVVVDPETGRDLLFGRELVVSRYQAERAPMVDGPWGG